MTWFQTEMLLKPRPRGFHLITDEVLQQIPRLSDYQIGLAHFFLKHTSASLTINENAAPEVRTDLETCFNRIAPENAPYYLHTEEGPDDMPAHFKASMIGVSLTVPISKGKLNLGIWQGLYLCEHRNQAHGRKLVITLQGVTNSNSSV